MAFGWYRGLSEEQKMWKESTKDIDSRIGLKRQTKTKRK